MNPSHLSALEEAATRGPWHCGNRQESLGVISWDIQRQDGVPMCFDVHPDDAHFIAALRNAAPALLALWKAADNVYLKADAVRNRGEATIPFDAYKTLAAALAALEEQP